MGSLFREMAFRALSDAAYVALRPSEERLLLSFALVQADPTQLVLLVLSLDPRVDLDAETRSLLLNRDGSLRTERRCDIGLRAGDFGNPAHPDKTVDRTVGPLPRRPSVHRRQPLPGPAPGLARARRLPVGRPAVGDLEVQKAAGLIRGTLLSNYLSDDTRPS